MTTLTEKRPCDGCGYRIRGGNLCGDCREYGPPKGWRWEWNGEQHVRVVTGETACRVCDCLEIGGVTDDECFCGYPVESHGPDSSEGGRG